MPQFVAALVNWHILEILIRNFGKEDLTPRCDSLNSSISIRY